MAYHLALIGELRHHVPPAIPYVTDVPLAYHWFFYAEAAATSWATGIEPIVLLYRLSGLPMFAAFVVLTAMAARRLTDRWWTGPLAVAIALFAVSPGRTAGRSRPSSTPSPSTSRGSARRAVLGWPCSRARLRSSMSSGRSAVGADASTQRRASFGCGCSSLLVMFARRRREGQPAAGPCRRPARLSSSVWESAGAASTDCCRRARADRRRVGSGDDPALSSDVRRAGHRSGIAAVVSRRGSRRCPQGPRCRRPRPAGRSALLVAVSCGR